MENKDCKHEILNYEFKIDKMTNISCAECGENDKSKLPVGAKVIRNSVFDRGDGTFELIAGTINESKIIPGDLSINYTPDSITIEVIKQELNNPSNVLLEAIPEDIDYDEEPIEELEELIETEVVNTVSLLVCDTCGKKPMTNPPLNNQEGAKCKRGANKMIIGCWGTIIKNPNLEKKDGK